MMRLGNGTGLRGVRALVVALVASAPTLALAHARLMTPNPRNTSDGLKTGPCGNVARTTAFTTYDAGATIPVRLREGIDHTGCFQVALSTNGNDTNWVTLTQMQDDGGTANTEFVTNVTLPAGVTCERCTLQLRQLMQGNAANPGPPCAPDASPEGALNGTYYSCADIRIGYFADAAVSTSSSSSSSSGGSTSSGNPGDPGNPAGPGEEDPNDPGGNLRAGQGDACSFGWGTTTGVSAFAGLGIALAALARRRRR